VGRIEAVRLTTLSECEIMRPMFRYVAVVLLLAGCSESSAPPPPPPPEPLPPRENITGTYEGRLGDLGLRIRLTDDDGALSGSYAIRTGPTGEFNDAGTLTGSARQSPTQSLTQDVTITLAGTLVGTFTGTATGRSRLAGTIEYQPGDGSGGPQTLQITLTRSGF